MVPRAYVGSAEGGEIYALHEGHQDGGVAVDILAEGNPIAPGGADTDSTFERVYLTLTWSMTVTLRCTPIVDDVALTDAQFDVVLEAAPNAPRVSQVFERALGVPFKRLGVTKYRRAPRGTWFALRIESVNGIGAGDLIIDEVVLEATVEDPTKEKV